MEGKYNQVVLTTRPFEKYSRDKEIQRQKMRETANNIINALIELDYVCLLYQDETDILIIEYQHNQRFEDFGCATPVWLDPEELCELENIRDQELDEDNREHAE